MMISNIKLKKYSVTLWGHRTSVTLENIFWQELKKIALQKKVSIAKLIQEIDDERGNNLSSAIRVFVLMWHLREEE